MNEFVSKLTIGLLPFFIIVIIFYTIFNIFIKCKNNIKNKNNQKNIDKKTNGGICPICGSQLIMRNGKYGNFIGCSNFPKCRYTVKKFKFL